MTEKTRKVKACKCGARTPEEHAQAILGGYRVHTYSGPKPEPRR